ncbi:MAG: OadG family protein [Eubacterium sp.]|nr:OadG family protein [Eubacterium sp.]
MSPILLAIENTDTVTFTTTVVISGITIVVGVLLLLIYIFELFGKIVPSIEKKANEKAQKRAERKAKRKAAKAAKKKKSNDDSNIEAAEKKPAPIKSSALPVNKAPVVEPGISGEVVAAIAAAVAMTEGAGAVVRSIRKKNVGGRNPWAQAANIENTRPF